MRTALLGTLIIALAVGIPGCKKKPKTPKNSGDAPAATTPTGDPKPGDTKPGDMRPAPRAAAGPASAAAACAKGALPGKNLSKKEFDVTVKAPQDAAAGKAAQAEIAVVPKSGYKYNLKYPTELIVKKLSAGVKTDRKTYENKQATKRDKTGLQFVVKYTPAKAGKAVVGAMLDFSVCTKKVCLNKEVCVAWESTVK